MRVQARVLYVRVPKKRAHGGLGTRMLAQARVAGVLPIVHPRVRRERLRGLWLVRRGSGDGS
jgi:hypothetical protein